MFNHKASLSFRKATKTTLTGAFAFGLLTWIGASPARGSNLVTVEGKDYAIIFQYTSFNNISTILRSQPWWGNSTAASTFARSCWYSACKSNSGYVIETQFAYEDRGFTIGTWEASEDKGISNRGLGRGVAWRYAYVAANPIIPTGNISGGNGINLTSNLGSLITPEFQGGTLTVDQDNSTYTQNFTLNGSTTNAIDANGRVSTFSGIFRDSSNTAGNIIFRDSSAPNIANVIRLQGRHTYTGSSTIESGNVLLDGGSFFKTSPVTVKPGARLGILSSTKAEAGSTVVGGPGSRSHLDINGTFKINGDLTLLESSRTLFNSGDISDTSLAAGTRSLSVTGVLTHNGENIDSRGGNYSIDTGELRGSSNILVDGETLTLTIQNDSSFDGGIGDFNPGQQGGALIKKGNSTLALNRSQALANLSSLQLEQGQLTLNEGRNGTIQQTFISQGATLALPNTTSALNSQQLTINDGGSLQGIGTISGQINNEGSVSPGNSIGTLTIDGNYFQGLTNPKASLNIEVNGSTSDLLRIVGSNRIILLGGNLNISSYNNAPITPGNIYTAIDVTGANAAGGEIGLNTNLNVVGSSGMTFARETDPAFAALDKNYYDICTSSDSNVQENCTKLQFAWLKNDPKTGKPLNPLTGKKIQPPTPTPSSKTSSKAIINQVKTTGGATTSASSGNSSTNTKTCIANGGSISNCQLQNKPGTGINAGSSNSVQVAKTIDAGWASISASVITGVNGGESIMIPSSIAQTATKVNSGYTTNQTSAAKVTPDFVEVLSAINAVPTRQQLNQALHSITAEPYASMQSVALEAMEQFRANTLALSSGSKAIPFIAEEQVCQVEPGTITDPNQASPADCKQRTVQKLTPWSLLIDGTNTQASLNGTNDLASLDYNIFSSSYGLQYDFNRHWSAGAAFGYGRANLYNYQYADVRIESSTYAGSIWGTYRPSAPWKLTALAGYMNLQYDSDRNISFGGLNRTANANWSGNGFTAALAAEYDWVLSKDKTSRSAVRIKPNTFFSYALHNQGSFSESGAGALNLAVDSHTADSLIYGIGFQIETPIMTGKTSRLIPRLSIGYEYDFNGDANEEHQLTASFAEVPALGSMDVLGQNRGANALDVGLSLEYETSEKLSLYAGVGGAFWSNGNELSYGGGLRLRW